MLMIIGAAVLPFIIMVAAVRLTHSFIGGVITALIVSAALRPWEIGLWTFITTALAFGVSIPVVWKMFKNKRKGP